MHTRTIQQSSGGDLDKGKTLRTHTASWNRNVARRLLDVVQAHSPYTDGHGTLVLSNAKASDSGNYTCLATNSAGTSSVSTYITISDQPGTMEGGARLRWRGWSTGQQHKRGYREDGGGSCKCFLVVLDSIHKLVWAGHMPRQQCRNG